MPILKFEEDHLLRRFMPAMRPQSASDEPWALVGGAVGFQGHDLRRQSPTRGGRPRPDCDSPTMVLVPFGVPSGFRVTSKKASLIRLATHSEEEAPSPELFPWEDGA